MNKQRSGHYRITFTPEMCIASHSDEEIAATIDELMSGGLRWTDFLDDVQIESVVFVPDEVATDD